jgi:carboxyl-terminal processing protease
LNSQYLNKAFMNKLPPHIKTGTRIVGALIVLVIVFLGGVYTGYQNQPSMQKITGLVHKESSVASTTDFAPFWKAWELVDEKMPGSDKIDTQEKVYGAIKGLLSSYKDPYTTFFPPEENKVFETEISGEFNGIGIEIGQKDGVLTVIAPLKDTPADKAGIKAGDKIVKINDTITSDMTIDQAISIIRGEEGTPVSLTIIREGATGPKVFSINRSKITLPTVDTATKGDVFIISLYNFSAQATDRFHTALNEYLQSGSHKLVIDLRGNPGGYLDAATAIGGWFIPEGKVIVKEIGKTPDQVTEHRSMGPRLFPVGDQLVILVDRGSASAAEILAGALSEHGIGTLAGERTFGKGSVQELIKLTQDTSLKITVAKWYTPNGISISESGLEPKVKIPYTEGKNGEDLQLDAALKLFK